MLIQVNFESEIPIYTQLVYAIKEGIATKTMKPGDQLPSVRTLASDLGVNMLTVNKAYQQLKMEQFIQIHRKKGAIIHPEGIPKADNDFLKQVNEALKPFIVEAVCRGMSQEDFSKHVNAVFNEWIHKGEK